MPGKRVCDFRYFPPRLDNVVTASCGILFAVRAARDLSNASGAPSAAGG